MGDTEFRVTRVRILKTHFDTGSTFSQRGISLWNVFDSGLATKSSRLKIDRDTPVHGLDGQFVGSPQGANVNSN